MNQRDLRERLEMEAYNHLFALRNCESYNGFESPSVYTTEGVLRGMCIVAGIDFKVEKRWKIIFLKRNKKQWFECTLDGTTEEEADELMEYRKRQLEEERKLYSKFFG